MTEGSTKMSGRVVVPTRADMRIAWLAALAIAIHIAEAAIPSPMPGAKPGLANVVTVAVLCLDGWRAAVWVGLLRVLVGSLLIGTFLSPTFLMSLSGALASLLALGLASRLPGPGFSPMGLCLLAAVTHMMAQFFVAYSLFIPHPGLFALLPVLMTMAAVFGIVSGGITVRLLEGLDAVRA